MPRRALAFLLNAEEKIWISRNTSNDAWSGRFNLPKLRGDKFLFVPSFGILLDRKIVGIHICVSSTHSGEPISNVGLQDKQFKQSPLCDSAVHLAMAQGVGG